MSKRIEYIVITARALCREGGPITIEHYAGTPSATKKKAVSEGFEMYQSDDFFIGVLIGNKLDRCEDIDSDRRLHDEDLSGIAEQIDYSLTPNACRLCPTHRTFKS